MVGIECRDWSHRRQGPAWVEEIAWQALAAPVNRPACARGLQRFLALAAKTHDVLVAIDELDKLEAEDDTEPSGGSCSRRAMS